MFVTNFLEELKSDYKKNEQERRQIINSSNNILFKSKKAIFAIQKNKLKEAGLSLVEIEEEIISLEKKFKATRLNKEGSFKAAAEEYLEAKILLQIISNKKISQVETLKLSYESYLGGVCDAVGELVRYATNQAAKGKFSQVAKIKTKAEKIMEALADFDMTGYLRTKYDQARNHLRKLEQMAYEIKLRDK